MKKNILIVILTLSLVLLSSCNVGKKEELNHLNTEANSNEVCTSSIEDSTQSPSSIVYENIVYTNVDIDVFKDIGDDISVKAIPDDFGLVTSVAKEQLVISPTRDDFNFYGEEYELEYQHTTKYSLTQQSATDMLSVSTYKSGDDVFGIVEGSNKLTMLVMLEKTTPNKNKQTITVDEAQTISTNFMKEFSLASSLNNFEVICYEEEIIRFFYKMYIGGYEIFGEKYVVGMNTTGEICFYSDDTTGLYDKFVQCVTAEDIERAESHLYPYKHPDAYGYCEPYLNVGNDGNLYLCSAYFVDEVIDGVEIAREYMFYSRVYYQE